MDLENNLQYFYIILESLDLLWPLSTNSTKSGEKNPQLKIFYKLWFATVLQNFQIKNDLMYILVLQLKGLISNAHNAAFSIWHSQYTLH